MEDSKLVDIVVSGTDSEKLRQAVTTEITRDVYGLMCESPFLCWAISAFKKPDPFIEVYVSTSTPVHVVLNPRSPLGKRFVKSVWGETAILNIIERMKRGLE